MLMGRRASPCAGFARERPAALRAPMCILGWIVAAQLLAAPHEARRAWLHTQLVGCWFAVSLLRLAARCNRL